MRPIDYERLGFTRRCRECTWVYHRLGARVNHSETWEARLEGEIATVEGDDWMQKVQERHDIVAAETK